MNKPITNMELKMLPKGFTSTTNLPNRKYRRSKEYQDKMREFNKLFTEKLKEVESK